MTPRPRVTLATLDFALLRGAIEEIPLGVATTRGTDIVYANGALERIYCVAPGALEKQPVSSLFGKSEMQGILAALDKKRVYDGRIRTNAFDGRAVDAEVHVERYRSESAGVGGFLVVRDVSMELGALGRLVDQLGGALFRLRVHGGALEFVSPSILALTGLAPEACVGHPELLSKLIRPEERERLSFMYRRLAHGDVPTASAQVILRRADGTEKLLHLRATGRKDTTGVVTHVEGVVTEAAGVPKTKHDADAEPVTSKPTRHDGAASSKPRSGREPPPGEFSSAVMDISAELLRESDQQHQALAREMRLLRGQLAHPAGAGSPGPAAQELANRLERMTASIHASSALNRRVRRALRGGAGQVTVHDLLENVRAALAPSFGEAPLTITRAADASPIVLDRHVDAITLVLIHLAFRAFRLVGSGSLWIEATVSHDRELVFEIAGRSPVGETTVTNEVSSDVFGTVPHPTDVNRAEEAARTLLLAVGGTVECEEANLQMLRSIVRIRLS